MRKKLVGIFFCLLSVSLLSQNNMVDNPGFENSTLNPCTACEFQPNIYSSQYSYWLKTWPWTLPEAAGLAKMSGSPDLVCGVTGQGRVGYTTDSEFLFQQFQNGSMQTGHVYYLEYKYRASSGSTTTTGLTFLSKRSHQFGDGGKLRHPWPCAANLQIPSANYDGQWHTNSCYWPASDNFPWLAVGNMDNDGGHFSVDWDDFKIFDVGSSECPPTNYIQNQTFADINGIIYKSKHLTYSDNTTIQNTAWVVFKSEQEVALMPGFNTDPGSKFDAIIAPCSDGPCLEPSPYITGTDELCSMAGQQVQLGGPSIGNTTYQWAGSCTCGTPINLLLSSTTVSDPVLTIPSGAGSINLSETVTSGCSGQSKSGTGVIFYDDNPDSNPTVSASPSSITLSSSNSHPSITIQGTSHTEVVYIELYDSNNELVNNWMIDNFPANQQGSFQYSFTDLTTSFDPCSTYQYKIYSENICYEGTQSTIATVDVSSSMPITVNNHPNILTPNCDGCNDFFCWDVTGATDFEIYVYDPNGSPVWHQSGPTSTVYQETCNGTTFNSTACVWTGGCGGPGTACTPGQPSGYKVPDGTYYYVLTFSNCKTTLPAIYDFVTLLGPTNSCHCCNFHREMNPNDTTNSISVSPNQTNSFFSVHTSDTLDQSKKMSVYPNPSKDFIFVSFTDESFSKERVNLIEVYDYLGNIVMRTYTVGQSNKIDISKFENGAYTVVGYSDNSRLRKSFVVQR